MSNPITINVERNHFRVEMRIVIEAPSEEAAHQKIMSMVEAEFVKDWSVAPSEEVVVNWAKRED